MDSCNSGSLQSSSGGDEEYDSRAAVFTTSPFLNNPTNPPPPPPQPLFDPLSNYFLNQTIPWPRPASVRSDPNHLTNSFISSFQPAAGLGTPGENNNNNNNNYSHAPPQPPQQIQNQAAAVRNPKKRSRASRRAPTTVLTTDTTNFRAMVQEFTGIPAPPFNNSPFQRTKLDLFTAAPPYLSRPFAQKIQSPAAQPPPFLVPFSSSSSANNNNVIANSVSSTSPLNDSSSTTPSTINYQLPITQSSNLFNLPFQTNLKFPFSDLFGSKDQQGHDHSSLGINVPFNTNNNNDHGSNVKLSSPSSSRFGEFGLSRHGNSLTSLPNLISANQATPRNDQSTDAQARNDLLHAGAGDAAGYEFSRTTMTNVLPENNNVVGTRGTEGMVESWICSNSE